ncbi:MAG: polysaccharide deacetylase family protein [Burkholderiaceae bacterium]
MKTKFRLKTVVLLGARTLGLFALSRHLTRSHLRILCYHGGVIGDEYKYNPKLFCSAKTLHQRMKWMKRRGFNFVTLNDGVTQQAGSGAKASLRTVVTFDDGWYSTASELLPVLSKMKIPSTLYLSTKNFSEGWPILNVAVRYIIWKAGQHPKTVHGYGPDVDGEYDLQEPATRHRLACAVANVIQESTSGRDQVCAELDRFANCLGVPVDELRLNSRRFEYVNKEELLNIAEQGCSIELHGHIHEYPKGNPLQLIEDLRKCEHAIVGLGLPRPRHYCYPSGSFGAEASAALSELGIRSATTCIPGLVTELGSMQRHYLPRFLDGEDVHPLEFEAEMSGFSELLRSALRFIKRRNSSLQFDAEELVHVDA